MNVAYRKLEMRSLRWAFCLVAIAVTTTSFATSRGFERSSLLAAVIVAAAVVVGTGDHDEKSQRPYESNETTI